MNWLQFSTFPRARAWRNTLRSTSGILVTVVVAEMIPAAHEGGEARFATAFFVGGFALFTLLSIYLG
jgi:ZIP family zinc transporter